jgi:hypothetical protein
MKTIYITKQQMPPKKRKPSFQRAFKKRYKELKKEIEDYKRAGWTFSIVHRGKNQHLQYLIRQKKIEGKHITVHMHARDWKNLDRKLYLKAQQDIKGNCWGGYNLIPSELQTYFWIMDYTAKRRRIDPSPLMERYRKKLRMRYDSRTSTCYISPLLSRRMIKNILKAARKAILRASNIVMNRIE